MPYVNVRIIRGASAEQKAEVIAGITEVLERVLNKPPHTTYVTIDELETDNWGVGGESLTVRRAREAAEKK